MDAQQSHTSTRERTIMWIAVAVFAALLVKFLWPLFVFDLPLGYDVGFYRYLFITHAQGFPPFWIAELEPWAREHPLGLFFFTTILMRLGVPADWLIGWIWNVFPVLLALALANTMRRRHGNLAALGTLIAALLSIAYFDGFAAMYWKTYASLFWCVLAFDSLERRQWWFAIPFGIIAVATHHQTGLLFGLVFISWLVLPFMPFVYSTKTENALRTRDLLIAAGAGALILVFGLLAYLPILREAIYTHLPALLGQTEAGSGSFPPASFYLRTEGFLLLLGAYGMHLSLRRERWTVWQLAVLWSLLFVVMRMLFYRRFFLQLDFFLLPFAGLAFAHIWVRFSELKLRGLFALLLIIQCLLMQRAILRNEPISESETFAAVLNARDAVPANAFILSLENDSAVLLRGWMPERAVGGPGLFASQWSMEQWGDFLLGSHEQRVSLLAQLPQPTYLLVTPYFRDYYGEYAESFLKDSCFEKTPNVMLYRVTCIQQ
jgi:hypothetical protein